MKIAMALENIYQIPSFSVKKYIKLKLSPNPIITLKTTSAMLPGRTNTVEITPATNHPNAIVVKKSINILRLKFDKLFILFQFFLFPSIFEELWG